jgi:hypothetical protein
MAFTIVQYIRMVGVSLGVGSGVTQYTVPAARQDVVKTIVVCNNTTGSLAVSIVVSGTPFVTNLQVPGNNNWTWTGTLVMNAADTIQTSTAVTGLTLSVHGLESQ